MFPMPKPPTYIRLYSPKSAAPSRIFSDKISALSLFDCTLAFANNGKPIGSPDNGGYFTLHTTEQGSTDVAYSGVTAVTIK